VADDTASSERRLWEMFVKETGERTQRMIGVLRPFTEGRDPTEGSLEEALEDARREAHTVKGAAGMMGQRELYELGERLDYTLRAAKAERQLSPEVARALIEGASAFSAGAQAASRVEALPETVSASIEALAET
jgi:chemotaxis protein histidine kinase CheA